MAKVSIKLVWNPTSRKRDILVDYHSDADALAFEHEDDHKNFVNKLIEGGVVSAQEAGQLIINRDNQSGPEQQISDHADVNTTESKQNSS